MRLCDGDSELDLRPLRAEGGDDDGHKWMVVSISGKGHGRRFHSSGPWLTRDEFSELVGYLFSLSGAQGDSQMSFIEPNISFRYEKARDRLTVSLDEEARPNWAPEDRTFDLPFEHMSEVANTAAKELEKQLGTVG